MPLLASRGLLLEAKEILYSTYVCSVMLYGSETWPVKEQDFTKLEGNDAKVVRWMSTNRSEDRIPAEEHGTRLKLE